MYKAAYWIVSSTWTTCPLGNLLTKCISTFLFFTSILLCSGQRKLWRRVLFIFPPFPRGPHAALEMSVGSLLWRGALTFSPHPHWQPMCQLVAFSAGVGVREVENTEERETQEKETELVYEHF